MTLKLMVRVVSWIFGEMRNEGLVSGALIIVGRILGCGIFHAVALRVAKRLCTSSRHW